MENAKKTICINNKKILINTNKKIIIDEIINYFKDYTSENKNLNIDFIFYILIDSELYTNPKIQYLCNAKYFKDIYYIKFKKKLIIINRVEKKIAIIAENIDSELLQDVDKIILNVLYKLMEMDNILFIEAAGIAIDKNTTILIGERNFIKDILDNLLREEYKFVCAESIGIIKNMNSIDIFCLPEKTKLRETYKSKIILNTKLVKILFLTYNKSINNNVFSKVNKRDFVEMLKLKHNNHYKKYIKYMNKVFDTRDNNYINYNDLYNSIDVIRYAYNNYDISLICSDLKKLITAE